MNEKSDFSSIRNTDSPLTEKAADSQELPSDKKKKETINNASSFGTINQPKSKTQIDATNIKRSTQTTIEEPVDKTIYLETREQMHKRTFFLRVAIILIIINLLLIANAFSQLITTNYVTITNTTQITARGDVLFVNGATSINDGTIDLSGNFINNSGTTVFGTRNGTVILNGAAQQIEGSSVTHFKIKNTKGQQVSEPIIHNSTFTIQHSSARF